MVASVHIEVGISRQQFVPMSGLQNFTLKTNFLKVLIVQKVKIFHLLFLTFKVQNLAYANICDDHHSSVLWSLNMQFNKHAVV